MLSKRSVGFNVDVGVDVEVIIFNRATGTPKP